MLPSPPRLTRDSALFLDVDGTLLELAPTPDSVRVPEGLAPLLGALSDALGGALAVVTGRSLARIEKLLSPWAVVGAGLHGIEFRWPGAADIDRAPFAPLSPVVAKLRARFASEPAVEVEDKGVAVALHFRRAPERAAECAAAMAEIARSHPELRLLRGHCVIEALPVQANKGDAIRRLMQSAPFAGRVPAFVGDDVTDEDAFPVVGSFGGLCIKVGQHSSYAAHGVDGPRDVLEWLRSSLRSLQSGDDEHAQS